MFFSLLQFEPGQNQADHGADRRQNTAAADADHDIGAKHLIRRFFILQQIHGQSPGSRFSIRRFRRKQRLADNFAVKFREVSYFTKMTAFEPAIFLILLYYTLDVNIYKTDYILSAKHVFDIWPPQKPAFVLL
jgi:hypothetical protein